MTTPVTTNGFVEPPAAPAVNGTPINIPAPVAPVAAAPAATPAAAAPAGLDAAIAALTEAMRGAAPAAPVVQEPAVQTGLNTYDVNGIDDPIIKSMATVMQTVGKGLARQLLTVVLT